MLTRPATARVRQSIFSRLAARIDLEGLSVLDLFAGSGSLGIEALSRGAARATFVDSSPAAAATLRHNLETLRLSPRGRIVTSRVEHALESLKGERFDLIFIDAPYRDDTSTAILERLTALELLDAGAFIVVRQSRRAPAAAAPAALEVVSEATLGDHRIALYRRADNTRS
jgi:16S rRNA (guanine966-N2)-methyltransferase